MQVYSEVISYMSPIEKDGAITSVQILMTDSKDGRYYVFSSEAKLLINVMFLFTYLWTWKINKLHVEFIL